MQPSQPDDRAFAAAAQAKTALYAAARQSIHHFGPVVMRDEETGAPWRSAACHVRWQDFLTAHDHAVLWAPVEHAKTQQIAVARVLWEIGRDPTLRVVVLCDTDDQAAKVVRMQRKYIDSAADSDFHRVFPGAVPSKGDPQSDHSYTIKRPTVAKDPTVQAAGAHSAITGSRVDLLIIDDLIRWEHARSAARRRDLLQWFKSSAVLGRLTKRGRVWIAGTAWHRDDLMHVLANIDGWPSLRERAMSKAGVPLWAAQWPRERIEARTVLLGPLESSRQLYNEARDDASARCKQEWIDVAERLGADLTTVESLAYLPSGAQTVTGVDLAVSKGESANETALCTLLVHADKRLQILAVEAGKWSGPEIIAHIASTHARFHSRVFVEDNAAQSYLLQWATQMGVTVQGLTTGRNKVHPTYGVESIFAELAAGRWIIPSAGNGQRDPQLARLISEMRDYDPDAHSGDRLMSCWIAREGSRLSEPVQTWHHDLRRR